MPHTDELSLALLRARRKYRVDLTPQVAERLITRVGHRYRTGQSFKDALDAVMNRVEWPHYPTRLAYRQVISAILGRRGGFAAVKKRVA